MSPIHVPATDFDKSVAAEVARHTDPQLEEMASFFTWGADEHLLIATAAVFWIVSRQSSARQRTAGNHLLALSFVTATVPHVLKYAFDQRRPDRLTIRGHMNGIPISGRGTMPFRQAMLCIWERSHPPPATFQSGQGPSPGHRR